MIFRNITNDTIVNGAVVPGGDWTFGQGIGNYTTKEQAIGLSVKTRILSWLNDCFFDLQAGIDWKNALGSKNQKTLLEAQLRRIIITSEGVTGIISFNTELDGRSFNANYTLETIYSKSFTDRVTLGVGNA